MRNIKYHKILNLVLILLFIIAISGVLISYVFNVNFVEKYIDRDQRIGEQVKTRINLFQTQMFYLSLFIGLLGLFLLAFKRRTLKFLYARPEFLTNIILLLIFLVAFFLLGEIIMRLFFSEMIYNEYGHGPGSEMIIEKAEYNSLGYRGPEPNMIKDKDTYRILFLGDSFTYGSGIKNLEDTYPYLVQNELSKTNARRIESVVMAKSGYSTLDELKVLKETGLKFKPDLIIIGYFLNDAEGEGSRKGYENMFYSHYTIPYEIGSIMYRYSFFYYFLESRLKNVITSWGFGKNNIDYTKHLYSDSNPYFQQHKKDLKELIELSNKNNIPILIIVIPYLQVDLKNYPYEDIDSYIEGVSKSNKAYFLDLLPYFQNYNLNDVRVSLMDAHMNKLGHNITSNAILEHLQNNFDLGFKT